MRVSTANFSLVAHAMLNKVSITIWSIYFKVYFGYVLRFGVFQNGTFISTY